MATIHEATVKGDVAAVRALLAAEPTLVNLDDQHKWRPIFLAALFKQLEVLQVLIDYGADLAAHDGYVMHYAAEVPDNKAVVALLMQYGALDAHTGPPNDAARLFIHAVYLANAERVAALLAADPSLATTRYARGDTSLHHACRNGDTAVVRLLLEHGAAVNALTEQGQFPLYCAAGHGHLTTTALLLEHGADRSQTLPDGKTVAAWLAQYADTDSRFKACPDFLQGP